MEAYKPAIRQILDYPFGQLKLPRISAEMALNNADGVNSAVKLGFRLEGRKRKKMRDGTDMGVFGLLAEDAIKAGFWTPYT
jgi:RimJ/RimL family protein N-acetyltransferase